MEEDLEKGHMVKDSEKKGFFSDTLLITYVRKQEQEFKAIVSPDTTVISNGHRHQGHVFSQPHVRHCSAPKWVQHNKLRILYLHNENCNAELFHLPCKGKTKARRDFKARSMWSNICVCLF